MCSPGVGVSLLPILGEGRHRAEAGRGKRLVMRPHLCPKLQRLLIDPPRLLQVQQRLVCPPEVVEVVPQQERVLRLASQLGPSQADARAPPRTRHSPRARVKAPVSPSPRPARATRGTCQAPRARTRSPLAACPGRPGSYARYMRHWISMVLLPTLHEAMSPMAVGIEGRSVRGGRRSASSRLSSAPSSAYAADSSNLPLNSSSRASVSSARAIRSGRSSKARAEAKAFRARAPECSNSPARKS